MANGNDVTRNAEINVEVDNDQAVASFNEVGDAAKKSSQEIQQGAQKSAEGLAKTQSASAQTAERMTQLKAGVVQAAGSLGVFAASISAAVSVSQNASPELQKASADFAAIAGAVGAGAAAFGPWGALVSGLVSTVPILTRVLREQEEAHKAAAAAARLQRTDLESLMDAMLRDRAMRRLWEGLGSVAEQTDTLTTATDRHTIRLGILAAAEAERTRIVGEMETAQQELNRVQEENAHLLEGGEASQRAYGTRITETAERVEALRRELESAEADVRGFTVATEESSTELGQYAVALAAAGVAAAEQAVSTQRAAEAERALSEAQARGAQARQQRIADAEALSVALTNLDQIEKDRASALAQSLALENADKALGNKEQLDAIARDNETFRQEQIAATSAFWRTFDEGSQEHNRRQVELARQTALTLAQTARTSAMEFSSAWEKGVDSVIESFSRANEAARAAGQAQMNFSRLAQESAKAAGDEVLESVGNKFANAFSQAMVAVITGAETFDVAMQKMLSSVLEGILAEAIVQSLVSFARAAADAASYNYAGAAANAVAGALWLGVAVAAGAAVGGMAAASAPAAPPSAAPAPSADALASSGASGGAQASSGGDIVVNINGNLFGTQAETSRTFERVMRNINEAA